MKQINTSIIRVKNGDGKFKTLQALRGATSYEVAVKAGFVGTEEEWLQKMIDNDWLTSYHELDEKKANKDDVYTKDETDSLVDNIGTISQYLTFAGNVNADMVSAAFGKGNEDTVMGIGKALKMYANFKENTDNVDFLDGYDKYISLVTDHKQKLIANSTLYELINSNTYAKDVVKNTNSGLTDIVLYDSGNTEYLDLDNATYTRVDNAQNIAGATNISYSLDTKVIHIEHSGYGRDTNMIQWTTGTISIPVVESLPDLRGYRYLNIKFADDVGSGMTTVYTYNSSNSKDPENRSKLTVSFAGMSHTINVIEGAQTNTYYHSLDLIGVSRQSDVFDICATNPQSDILTIESYLDIEEGTSPSCQYNIEKIWFSET